MLDWLITMYGKADSSAIQQLITSLENVLEKPTRYTHQQWLQQHVQYITPDLISALSLLTARLLIETTLSSTRKLYFLQLLIESLIPHFDHPSFFAMLQLLKIISEDAVGPHNIYDKSIDDVLKRLYNYRGSCLAEHGHYLASIDHFNSTIMLDLSFAPAYCNRARALLELNRYNEAWQDCQNLRKVDALYPQGQATCRLVEVLHNLTPMYHSTAAEIALKYGLLELLRRYDRPLKPGEAIRTLDQQVNPLEMPTPPPVDASTDDLNHFGLVQGRSGDIEGAIATFTRTIIVDPSYTKAYYNRAKAYTLIGEYEKALADYQFILKHKPNDPEAQLLFAQTQKDWQEQQSSQTIQVNDKVNNIRQEYRPEKNEYLRQAKYLSCNLHRHQQAIQDLFTLPYSDYLLDSTLPARRTILQGSILLRQGQADEALRSYQEAWEMLTNTIDHYLLLSCLEGLARCHLHLHQLHEAELFFQKALDITVAQPYPHAEQRLHHLLGTCKEQDQQFTAAIINFQKACDHATTQSNWGGAFAALSRLAPLHAMLHQDDEHKRVEKEMQKIVEEQELLAYAGPNAQECPHTREQAIAALFPDGLPSISAITNPSELFTQAAELRKNKQYQKAIPLYLTLLAHSLHEDKPGNTLDCLNALGICYLSLTEEAVNKARYDFLAPAMQKDVSDSIQGSILHTLLATPPSIYAPLFGSSIELASKCQLCHLWCLEISKDLANLESQASQISNLAILEETLGNLDTASRYQRWAFEYHTYTDQPDDATIDLIDLAHIEKQLGNDEYATSLYQQAEEMKHVQST